MNNEYGAHIRGGFYVYTTGNTGDKIVTIEWSNSESEFISRIYGAISTGTQYDDRLVCSNGADNIITTVLSRSSSGSTDLNCISRGIHKFEVPHFKWEFLTIIASCSFTITFTDPS